MSSQSLDDLRWRNPDCGFALYAYDPAGPVTLEVHDPDGTIYTFVGPTAEAAMALAFPPATEPEPTPPPTPVNIFD